MVYRRYASEWSLAQRVWTRALVVVFWYFVISPISTCDCLYLIQSATLKTGFPNDYPTSPLRLTNRFAKPALFSEQLEHYVNSCKRRNEQCALLFIDPRSL